MLTLEFVGPGRTSSLCPNVVQRNISLASSVMVEPTYSTAGTDSRFRFRNSG